MGTRDHHLGTPGGPADLRHIDLQAVALLQDLSRHLLGGGQVGVGKLATAGNADGGRAVARVQADDDAGQDLALLGGELVVNHPLLGLPHTLDNDLAGGLGGDAAKGPGLDLYAQHVAQLSLGQLGLGLLQGHLGVRIVHGLHHVLLDVHLDLGLLLVKVHHHVVGDALMVPLIGGHQSLGDLVQHIALGDALLLLDEVDGGKKLLAVQLNGLGGGCFLSHCYLLLR